ncbi:CXADR-like membrane protein [Polypterus senegalus]|uniref:CXADR-like membrane protein n=1 Tax=Polypterus senegalus TaxID=55291 RepID=UPI0019645F72|nr:CXADR-like membrane protein [Polypterus senegalus]
MDLGTVAGATFRLMTLVVIGMSAAKAQSEIKMVAETDVTLPCSHQLWHMGTKDLDIEWLLQRADQGQKVVISYSSGQVYDSLISTQAGRVSFAADFLKGDASLKIAALQLGDSGHYTCKVKNGGQYSWNSINLLVLVKPSKPKCWHEGKFLEGSELKLGCKSTEGTEPIVYKWERIPKNERSRGYLPPQSRIDLSNPEIVILRNLTQESAGLYQCTASNEAGEESCVIPVSIHYVRGVGVIVGAVVGVGFGVFLMVLIIWLIVRKKEKKKYEEEDIPNEIREDAEAPKAKLMKPNSSSSSRSGSSRSGASSTQSMVHSSAPRSGHRPRVSATLKENGESPTYTAQGLPSYTQVINKELEIEAEPDHNKAHQGSLVRKGVTPAHSRPFETV